MLLTNRRIALIYLCLAGMEAAWFTPFWLLVLWQDATPLVVWAGASATLLAWMIALELLSRTGLRSPAYDAAALAALALVTGGVVLAATGGRPTTAFSYGAGFPPALALALGNLFLWQRAASATSREISFFGVGLSFRMGLILLIVGGGVAAGVRGLDTIPLLWIFFGLGLVAVGAARIHEKAQDAQSAGIPLPPGRLAQLLLTVGLTVAAMIGLAQVYTSHGILAFVYWFDPLWRVLAAVLKAVLIAVGWLLNPLLEWLQRRLIEFFSRHQFELAPLITLLQVPQQDQPGLAQRLPPWLRVVLLDLIIGVGVLVGLLVVVGLLLLWLERVRRPTVRDGDELATGDEVTFGGGIVRQGWQALRKLVGLVRRYGLGRTLLAAISIQNIYANLCRLARLRGYGRRPAQPPDVYLPVLQRAFPGHEAALARITAAYMRVHYGDRPVTAAELAALRRDYRTIRESESANERISESTNGRIMQQAIRDEDGVELSAR